MLDYAQSIVYTPQLYFHIRTLISKQTLYSLLLQQSPVLHPPHHLGHTLEHLVLNLLQ